MVVASLLPAQDAEATSTVCQEGAVLVSVASEPQLELLAAQAGAEAEPSLAEPEQDELLWCASPDDPRCAPRGGSSGSYRDGGLQHAGSANAPGTRPDAEGRQSPRSARLGLAPRAGVQGALERPPQRGRRAA
ncbi:MAG: hypothetical protein OEZ06_08895 [Myxococcales bacterium]|nr:hypothetical protein [Myxococcales bacterium]